MNTHQRMIKQGHWLFRRRGELPLLLLPYLAAIVLLSRQETTLLREPGWQLLCLAMALLGWLIRCLTVGSAATGTSGRNTKAQVADSLNTDGTYSIVRNPLYVGNYLMLLAPVLFTASLTAVIVFSLLFWLYYERIIIAEEQFLEEKYGDEFRAFTASTPAFIPNPLKWRAPRWKPSIRRILRREYITQLSMVTSLVVMDLLAGRALDHPQIISPMMLGLAATSLSLFLIVFVLLKSTRLLHEDARS